MKSLTKTVLIADREPVGRELIRNYLRNQDGFQVVGECTNSYETIRSLNTLAPDVLFVDEQLYRTNSNEMVRKIVCNPLVVFTAENESFAVEAFENQAFDYLLKPYSKERFENTLRRISCTVLHESPDLTKANAAIYSPTLFVADGASYKKINVEDIIYIKAARDYSLIYTTTGEYLSSFGISFIEERLDPLRFCRVHRSFIVNLDYVTELCRESGKTYLILKNGCEVNIGRYYMGSIKQLII